MSEEIVEIKESEIEENEVVFEIMPRYFIKQEKENNYGKTA